MTTINNLSTATLAAADKIAVWSTANGDSRKASLTALLAFIEANMTGSIPQLDTFYSAPSATGFTVTLTDSSANQHLILTPVAGYATGTIKLPASTNATDKQLIMVNCTQAVTTLTVDGNGATVTGEPASLSANDFFTLKFDEQTATWYRVT